MSGDIATLGIRIESADARRAKADLDALTASGAQLESSTNRLAQATTSNAQAQRDASAATAQRIANETNAAQQIQQSAWAETAAERAREEAKYRQFAAEQRAIAQAANAAEVRRANLTLAEKEIEAAEHAAAMARAAEKSGLTGGGNRAREAVKESANAMEQQFRAEQARIQLLQRDMLMSPEQAAEAGRKNAESYNAGLQKVIDKGVDEGAFTGNAEGNEAFADIVGRMKNVTEESGRAQISMGKLRDGVTSFAASALGAAPGVGRLSSTIGSMALGTGMMVGVMAGAAALGFAWKALTRDARETAEATKKAMDEIDRLAEARKYGALEGVLKNQETIGADINATQQKQRSGLFRSAVEAFLPGQLGDVLDLLPGRNLAELDTHLTAQEDRYRENVIELRRIQAEGKKNQEQSEASALASLVAANNATAAERARAREILAAHRAELTKPGTTLERRAELTGEIEQLTAAFTRQTPAMKEAERAARDLAEAQREIKQGADDSTRLLEAAKESEAAFRAESNAIAVRNTLRDAGIMAAHKDYEATKAQVEATIANREAIEKVTAARKMAEEATDSGRLLEAAKLSEAAFRAESDAIAVRNMLREAGITAADADYEAKKDEAQAIIANTHAINDEREARQKAEDERRRATEQAEQDAQRALERTTRNVQRQFSDLFQGIVSGAINSFDSLFAHIGNGITKVASDVAARKLAEALVSEESLGRYSDSQRGAAAAVAGIGVGYSVGSQVGGGMGIAGGAAAGALIGSQILPGIGTAIGAFAGLAGGILGAADAAREARERIREMKIALETSFSAAYGDELEQVQARIRAEAEAIRKLGKEAFPDKSHRWQDGDPVEERYQLNLKIAEQEREKLRLAEEDYNFKQAEAQGNLAIRQLRADGLNSEADALGVAMERQREYHEAVQEGADAAYLAALAQVQLAEAQAAAAKIAEATARQYEDLTLRAVVAGNAANGIGGRQADDMRFSMEQERELAGADPAIIAFLRTIHDLEARARERAFEQINTQAQEDYRVRTLAAQGRTAEADALARTIHQQREYQNAVMAGMDEATLAALALAHAAETAAVAAAAAAEKAARHQEQMGDLGVRLLRVNGQDRQADDMAFTLGQWRELATLIKEGAEPGVIEAYKRLHEAEAEARERARQQSNVQAQEDYRVRTLAAQGRTAEADALRMQLDQQREWQTAVSGGMDAATLAALAQLHLAETQAEAAEIAEAAAREQEEAAKRAFEAVKLNVRAQEDYRIRILAAEGRTQEADALRMAIEQQREWAAAVDAGMDAATMDMLELVHAAEQFASAAGKVEQSAREMESLNVRALTAQGRTREAEQARMDAQHRRERADAQRNALSPDVQAQIAIVQQLEQDALQRENDKQDLIATINAASEAYTARLDQQIETARDQLTAARDQLRETERSVNLTESVIENLTRVRESMMLGGSTILSPVEQLAEARRQYGEVLGLAQGGDKDAAMRLGQSAQALLDASREVNASGRGYVADFQMVRDTIDAVTDQYGGMLTVEQQMLEQLRAQSLSLETQITELQAARQAAQDAARAQIDAINAGTDTVENWLMSVVAEMEIARSAALAHTNATIDALRIPTGLSEEDRTVLTQNQTDLLNAIDQQITAILSGASAAEQGMYAQISELERLRFDSNAGYFQQIEELRRNGLINDATHGSIEQTRVEANDAYRAQIDALYQQLGISAHTSDAIARQNQNLDAQLDQLGVMEQQYAATLNLGQLQVQHLSRIGNWTSDGSGWASGVHDITSTISNYGQQSVNLLDAIRGETRATVDVLQAGFNELSHRLVAVEGAVDAQTDKLALELEGARV